MQTTSCLAVFSALLLSVGIGCRATDVIRVYDETGKTTKVYTVVRDPESTFSITAKDFTGSLKGGKGDEISAELHLALTTVLLAERLDQINAQTLALVKAAFFGLNSNPTDPENQKMFWKTLEQTIRFSQSTRMFRYPDIGGW